MSAEGIEPLTYSVGALYPDYGKQLENADWKILRLAVWLRMPVVRLRFSIPKVGQCRLYSETMPAS